ncbi:Putative D-isomer specific 2-hydroxyacid dehydrogenase, NAD-binding domain-containing protein [Colletotrichum destructivum]|uniref:D-isomer specific 2-hydroxyacid dehydrogenase, NAD-binding domain-containing protein n=1 Tax=Colletotrichum destructivum TaxID=34406 RepID=A0AAX4J373_9PEZI|nr:Putative D-isomer specific 2-hydroxyacid dehydrogenase, NAD-binding domain-containing protein [Colletotrichum destructivum]
MQNVSSASFKATCQPTRPSPRSGSKPVVLRLGEDIQFNHNYYNDVFAQRFDVVANKDRGRPPYIKALENKKQDEFRPHFQTGGEMGHFASAGPGTPTRSQQVARTYDPDEYLVMHLLLSTISWNPRGHVLGIIGLSHVSKKLAYKALTALGMEIHYHEVVRSAPEVEEELQATLHLTLHALMGASDCVTFRTPNIPTLVNAEAFATINTRVRLENTAQGQAINQEALIAALSSVKLSAAALDVHYHESRVSRTLAVI